MRGLYGVTGRGECDAELREAADVRRHHHRGARRGHRVGLAPAERGGECRLLDVVEPRRPAAETTVGDRHERQPLDALDTAFAAARLRGAVVRGPDAGTPLGIRHAAAFADRVRR